jgi:hypothetical protein
MLIAPPFVPDYISFVTALSQWLDNGFGRKMPLVHEAEGSFVTFTSSFFLFVYPAQAVLNSLHNFLLAIAAPSCSLAQAS